MRQGRERNENFKQKKKIRTRVKSGTGVEALVGTGVKSRPSSVGNAASLSSTGAGGANIEVTAAVGGSRGASLRSALPIANAVGGWADALITLLDEAVRALQRSIQFQGASISKRR